MEFEIQESRYQVPLALAVLFWIIWLFVPALKTGFKK
jgi:hypothetical protein